jgi:RNA polymerase sigma-70 factor (family 1)
LALSEELVTGLRSDNPIAMEQIFNLHWESVFDAAFQKVGDESVAQDITQEIFISLWENRKNLILTKSLSGYLYGAVKYKVINYYRSNTIKEGLEAEFSTLMAQQQTTSDADENIIFQDTRKQIDAAMARLPERMRLVISMSRDQDKSIKEIAAELNVSVQTVKNQITASMKLLREAIFYVIAIVLLWC